MGWIVIIGLVVVAIIVVAVFSISAYNELVKLRNKTKNSWAHIDAQLQRRFDLIPNLVEIVKGFVTHEKQILENVMAAREEYIKAITNSEKLVINEQLSSNLKSLFHITESYPELKSSAHFLQLQSALTEIEEDISYARQFYNDSVTIYNNKLMMFPYNMIASKYNFKEEVYFDANKAAESTIKIDFSEKPRSKYAQCPNCGASVEDIYSTNCKYCGRSLVQ